MYSKRMVLFISFLSLMISADLTAQTTEWTLEWDDPNEGTDITISYYLIYRSNSPDTGQFDSSYIPDTVFVSEISEKKYIDSNLEKGRRYYYWVKAVSDDGIPSDFSATHPDSSSAAIPDLELREESYPLEPGTSFTIDLRNNVFDGDNEKSELSWKVNGEEKIRLLDEPDSLLVEADTILNISVSGGWQQDTSIVIGVFDPDEFNDIDTLFFNIISDTVRPIIPDIYFLVGETYELNLRDSSIVAEKYHSSINELQWHIEPIDSAKNYVSYDTSDANKVIFRADDENSFKDVGQHLFKFTVYTPDSALYGSIIDTIEIQPLFIFSNNIMSFNEDASLNRTIGSLIADTLQPVLDFSLIKWTIPNSSLNEKIAIDYNGLNETDPITFRPASNWFGTDSVVISATYYLNSEVDTTFIFNVTSVNDTPHVTIREVTLDSTQREFTFDTEIHATDADSGDILKWTGVEYGESPFFTILDYPIAANETRDSIKIMLSESAESDTTWLYLEVSDSSRATGSDSVKIIMDLEPNVPPIAINDIIEMDYSFSDTTIYFDALTVNDDDPDDERSPEILDLDPPVYGEITKNMSMGFFTYIPDSEQVQLDSMQYYISDSKGAKDSAYVFFVFSPDTLIIRYIDATEDTELELDVVEIMNSGTDKSFDNFKYMYTEEGYPINGSLPEENGNRITYKPNQNYNQTDTLLCVTSNGKNSIKVKIVLKIASVNDPPTITLPDITLFNSFGDSAEFDLDSYVSDDTDRRSEHYFPPEMFDWNVIINPEDSTAFRIDTLKLRDRLLALKANREKWTRPVDFLLTATDTMGISSSINVRTTLNSFINFEAPTVVSGTTYILRWETGFIAKSMVRYGIDNLDSTSMLYYTATHRHELSNLQENSTYTYAAYVIQGTDTTEAETGTFTTGSNRNVNIFPNPFNPNEIPEHDFIYVSDFPQNATFQVFNLLGEPVFNYKNEEGGRIFRWRAVNEKSKKLQSGLYIYVIKDEHNKKLLSGKIVIIR